MTTSSQRMPVLFIGHGSPMNAVSENSYTEMLSELGGKLPTPKSIVVISAHWMTEGTAITHMSRPKTIHDFYGFPKALFDVQYPAPGSPETAEKVQSLLTTSPKLYLDDNQWGLDHGTWAVLKHMYPNANIPVMQLSLNHRATPEQHFKIGQELSALRDQGVLILGSGNIVHNLRMINWDETAPAHSWALEFDAWTKSALERRDFKSLLNHALDSQVGKLSIPTPEHYLPMHYILGAANSKDELKFEYEEMQNGSLSMRSFSFGTAV